VHASRRGGGLAMRVDGAVRLVLGDGGRLDPARHALVLKLFQLDDRAVRHAAAGVTVALSVLVRGASCPSRVDDVTAPADVADVDAGTPCDGPVLDTDCLTQVAEVTAVLRVVSHRAVGVRRQLVLDALDRPCRDLQQGQRRAETRRIQHKHVVLSYTRNATAVSLDLVDQHTQQRPQIMA